MGCLVGEVMLISSSGLSLKLNNQMKRTQTQLQKNIEKISTGQQIRRAANDTSGLAIKQKMLALERGSRQAIRNVQDATSLVQVADGAMQEMTDVLHRIRELTIQAMNGTNSQLGDTSNSTSSVDTLIIQNEIDDLKKGLSDIVHNTEFNKMKLLSNTEPKNYLYDERKATKLIQVKQMNETNAVNINTNHIGSNTIYSVQDTYISKSSETLSSIVNKLVETGETFTTSISTMNHYPRWSETGDAIVFRSNSISQFIIPTDGGTESSLYNNVTTLNQIETINYNGKIWSLEHTDSTLNLIMNDGTDTTSVSFNDYNGTLGSKGYSFSPLIDEEGNTSFVYADTNGDLRHVNINIATGSIGSTSPITPSEDAIRHTIDLPKIPHLYNMDGSRPSLQIQKVKGTEKTKLTYWDGVGITPDGGYYTVSDQKVTFYGDAIVESGENYDINYIPIGIANNEYSIDIPSSAEVYNMNGQEGPRSMKITVGGEEIKKEQLLAAKPAVEDAETTNGVYVDETSGKIYFYGDTRPSYNENISIRYGVNDVDGRNQIQTFNISHLNIDTYNLIEGSGLESNRSLRVYVGENEVDYSTVNGFSYENGKLSLHGMALPDLANNPSVRIEYIEDTTSTSDEVFGFILNHRPQNYNLGEDSSPNSIRVYKISSGVEEELAYSASNGFQYNQLNKRIDLHGTSRPNVGDSYKVISVVPTNDTNYTDSKVEIALSDYPETYPDGNPGTFQVLVDGKEVDYDPDRKNGYYYNFGTNKIELYGDARPDADKDETSVTPIDIQVNYVYETPVNLPNNKSYDYKLESTTLDYGVVSQSEPRAIRVYHYDGVNNDEIPYSAADGFTYDHETNQLSLHGSYRPMIDNEANSFNVYSIQEGDLIKELPIEDVNNVNIYKVKLNDKEIPQTNSRSGNGYYFDGKQVEIVGTYRPDVTDTLLNNSISVQYVDAYEVQLDDHMLRDDTHNYCNHETDNHMLPEIEEDTISVALDGEVLTKDKYFFHNNKIVLNRDNLDLSNEGHTISVDYRVRRGIDGYKENGYTFQVGANAGQSLKLDISSFDTLLRDTDMICVRNQEDAENGLKVLDKALDFVLGELGEMGAVENRLSHIASNLSNMELNTIASLSRISDTDMAKEAMDLVKNQLLVQTQQGMATQIMNHRERIIELLK